MIIENKLKNMIGEKEALARQIKEMSYELKKEKIFTDFRLFDKIEELKKLCDSGQLEKAEYIARQIRNALSTENIIQIERNDFEKIKEYSNQPAPNVFPELFELNGIEIMRGINVGLGSYPGIGKTTFACNLAYYNLMKNIKTLFISLEMPTVHIYIKMYLLFLHTNRYKTSFQVINEYIKNSVINQKEYDLFIEFVKRAQKSLIIVDYEKLTASQICYLTDEASKEFDKFPSWIIVDYIQRIQPEPSKVFQTMREKMIFISDAFTTKAKKEMSNFLLLSQLNQDGKFREASNIRDDVGMSIILNRKIDDDTGEYEPEIEMKIDKSRYTRLTKSTVKFHGKTGYIGG